jgi:mycothiol system anti-sigma-R factor
MSYMDDCGPDCQETLREVERFLDGELELEAALHVRIEEHLSACSPCMERAEFRRHLKILVSRKCVQSEVPAAFETRILRMIRELDTAE